MHHVKEKAKLAHILLIKEILTATTIYPFLKTPPIQISWLPMKPADQDLHCFHSGYDALIHGYLVKMRKQFCISIIQKAKIENSFDLFNEQNITCTDQSILYVTVCISYYKHHSCAKCSAWFGFFYIEYMCKRLVMGFSVDKSKIIQLIQPLIV